jgi:hypothetical protein
MFRLISQLSDPLPWPWLCLQLGEVRSGFYSLWQLYRIPCSTVPGERSHHYLCAEPVLDQQRGF